MAVVHRSSKSCARPHRRSLMIVGLILACGHCSESTLVVPARPRALDITANGLALPCFPYAPCPAHQCDAPGRSMAPQGPHGELLGRSSKFERSTIGIYIASPRNRTCEPFDSSSELNCRMMRQSLNVLQNWDVLPLRDAPYFVATDQH
ncbi:uncharacterized protein C8Q71DRAFT_378035 [Rhodofomes roseus]|uniref:Uncharacterized protein n=1 Tax=Rhodofomes roseus TaxID=34475 RepID=A0ABQ8K0B4_9APHY|nr:uncharacterized protein C8Q71DRAFT_378035 [Rhodofomes roseus]KAH9830101.1 hypothetical protein C8Q71DRAFT_378035 [Rhodofomes roseus]